MLTATDGISAGAQPAKAVLSAADAAAIVRALRPRLPRLSPVERIALVREHLPGPMVFLHGFGMEGQLLLHWICEHDLDVDIATLDTGRLFPETYELWAKTEARYGRRIRAIYPNQSAVEGYVAKHGINGFYDSKAARQACCDIRKVRPMERALSRAAAWMSALRADQSAVRRDERMIGFETNRGLIKLNPLFDWGRPAVIDEIKAHGIPVSPLHARGYASIGCAPCTRAIKPGDHERSGRWWWENDTVRECGLHSRKPQASEGELSAGAGCG
jgi:phosphoadenosine phosphosulfate reductase